MYVRCSIHILENEAANVRSNSILMERDPRSQTDPLAQPLSSLATRNLHREASRYHPGEGFLHISPYRKNAVSQILEVDRRNPWFCGRPTEALITKMSHDPVAQVQGGEKLCHCFCRVGCRTDVVCCKKSELTDLSLLNS